MAAPSRCRHVPPGCHIDRWASDRNRANVALDEPLVRSTTPRLDKPLELREGKTPDSADTAQVGRVYPKPPRCSPVGDANGVRIP